MSRPALTVAALLLATGCGSPGTSDAGASPAASPGSAASSPSLSPQPVTCPPRPSGAGASPSPRRSPPPTLVAGATGLPSGLPGGGGFSAFAIVDPGVLSRSGTPSADQFSFLRESGWHGIVDVRTTDDRTYAGFTAYGFRYLQVPIDLEAAPSDAQARDVLCFISAPVNQPVDVHDNSGKERVGIFIALYRYSAQGWTMDAALREEAAFGDVLSPAQLAFLQGWAAEHPPGRLP